MEKNKQKIKLPILLDILKAETDEEHPLTTAQITEKLAEKGIRCDRRTLSMDIDCLNENGYEIMDCRVGHDKAYYIEERGFDEAELRILLDAVYAANFITEKKTRELAGKIANQAGSFRGAILNSPRKIANGHKHRNESIYYSIDKIETAIREGKKISFRYFQLDEAKQPEFKKEERYILDPIDLVVAEDNYYLVTFNPKYGKENNYRVDRMKDVDVEEESVSPESKDFHVEDYTTVAFKMFGGEEKLVTLDFDRSLLGPVYDKFGEDVFVKRLEGDLRRVSVIVKISPPFYGWVFQFGTKMRIVEPGDVREGYRKVVEEVLGRIG